MLAIGWDPVGLQIFLNNAINAAIATALSTVTGPTSDPIQTQAVGASPYTYTNSSTKNCLCFVGGGTVSIIQVSQDGTTFISTGLTGGVFFIAPGGKIKITYILIPTFLYTITF